MSKLTDITFLDEILRLIVAIFCIFTKLYTSKKEVLVPPIPNTPDPSDNTL